MLGVGGVGWLHHSRGTCLVLFSTINGLSQFEVTPNGVAMVWSMMAVGIATDGHSNGQFIMNYKLDVSIV